MFPATASVSALFRLGQRDLRGLFAATTTVILDLEGDLRAVFQGRYARTLQRRGMDKDVLLATFSEMKPKPRMELKNLTVPLRRMGLSFPVRSRSTGLVAL